MAFSKLHPIDRNPAGALILKVITNINNYEHIVLLMRFGICSDSKKPSLANLTRFCNYRESEHGKNEEEKIGNTCVLSSYICPFAVLYKVQTNLFLLWSDPYATWPY